MPPTRSNAVSGTVEWDALLARLRRLARGLVRGADEADDLTQQTLVRVLATAPERAAHWGYVRQVLIRTWLTWRRSWRGRLAGLARYTNGLPRWHAGADAAADGELVTRARAAIERLPVQQRAALTLRLVEELDYETIAELLGSTVAAVRANLHLARRRVRAAVGEEP